MIALKDQNRGGDRGRQVWEEGGPGGRPVEWAGVECRKPASLGINCTYSQWQPQLQDH